MKRGLKPSPHSGCRMEQTRVRPKKCPDEEGIETFDGLASVRRKKEIPSNFQAFSVKFAMKIVWPSSKKARESWFLPEKWPVSPG